MESVLDLGKKKAFKTGLLVVSTLLIMAGSVFFYNRLVYERALSVSGTIAGSGSTIPTGLNATPATILILAVSAILISLSVFGFLREASRGRRNSKSLAKEMLATISLSLPPEIGPSLQIPSVQKEWEEAPEKEDDKP